MIKIVPEGVIHAASFIPVKIEIPEDDCPIGKTVLDDVDLIFEQFEWCIVISWVEASIKIYYS